jgi:DNA-binding response OmpR family regulator
VLVVSSDLGLSSFLSEGLVVGGFWVSVIGGAVQVLEVFRLRSFDLVLVDAALGGIGAIELVRRLRGRSSRAAGDLARTDVPIAFIAADPSEINPTNARAAGGDDVIYAPLDLDDLVRRLHELVRSWRQAHPDRPYADAVAQLRPGER